MQGIHPSRTSLRFCGFCLLKHSRTSRFDTLSKLFPVRFCVAKLRLDTLGSFFSQRGTSLRQNRYSIDFSSLSLFLRIRYDKNSYQLFLSAHFLHNKRLESIAFADVVELFDTDTAHYSLPQVGEGGPQLLATVVDEDATSA